MCIFKGLQNDQNSDGGSIQKDEFYRLYSVKDMRWKQVCVQQVSIALVTVTKHYDVLLYGTHTSTHPNWISFISPYYY